MILPKNTRAQEAAPHDEQRGQKTHENPLQPGPACHNQFIKDPLAHFLAIPWTAKLLTDPAVLHVVVPDRNPLASRDKQLVRSILNGETTVRACVAFFVGPRSGEQQGDGEGSKTTPLPRYHAVADLGEDLCGHRGTLHGAATVLLLDETMCGAVDHQSDGTFTVTMTTRFLKRVKLPGIVLVTATVIRKEGHKFHVRGSIEDNEGNLMAESEAVLVDRAAVRNYKGKL